MSIVAQQSDTPNPPQQMMIPSGQSPSTDNSAERMRIYSNIAGGMMVGTAAGGLPGFIVGGVVGLASGVLFKPEQKT